MKCVERMRKRFFLLLVGCLFITLIAACSSNNNEQGTQSPNSSSGEEKPLKFVYHSLSRDMIMQRDNEMHQWLVENKNVDIDLVADPQGDRILDKLNLMLASEDVPDVLDVENVPGAIEVLQQMGEAGLVISWDEWVAKYPDIVANNDKAYDDAVHRAEDGKLYMLPINHAAQRDVLVADVGPIIREDWLEQVGLSAPTTTDELYEVLKAFRDEIKEVDGRKVIPATFDHYRQFIANAWTENWVKFSDNNETIHFQFNNPDIEEYMVFMNKLYREGLLDQEMIIHQADQYMGKLSAGRVGYSVRVYWDMDTVNRSLKATDPNARFVPAPPLKVTGSSIDPVYSNPSERAFSSVVVSTKFAKDPRNIERLMEYLNWNASQEGLRMLKYGEEGKYYTRNADGLFEVNPEAKEEMESLNNTFLQRTGLDSYNILRLLNPKEEVNPRSEEAQMGIEVWADSVGDPLPLEFQLSTAGPIEQQKWGEMWAELDKWTSRAVFADSEEEARKITKEMLDAFEKNGGRDIVNERLELMKQVNN